FGATVTLADEETDEKTVYQIVGEDEADVSRGRLSVTSPLARALIGKGVGENVEVSTPRGSKYYEVVKVALRLDRHARGELRGADGKRGLDVAHIGRGGELGGEKALIVIPVLGNDLE